MNCISFMHTFLFKSDCGDLESVRLIAQFILIKSNPYRVFNFNFILTYWTLSRSAAPCSLSTPDFAVTFDRNKPQNIFFLKIKFGEYPQYYIRIVNPQYWKKKIENRKSLLKLNMIIEIYMFAFITLLVIIFCMFHISKSAISLQHFLSKMNADS